MDTPCRYDSNTYYGGRDMTRREIFELIFDTNLDFTVEEYDEMFFGETLEDEDLESIKERMNLIKEKNSDGF